jgi:dTMP kinase
MRGTLITVEGGEFTGKTSLIVPTLKSVYEKCGYKVLTSREPGGTPRAEELRKQIFARLAEGAPAKELADLLNQARRIHLEDIVLPFFKENKDGIVILDRYVDSTFVYQGLEGGVNLNYLKRNHENKETGAMGIYPDLTLILTFPEKKFVDIFRRRQKYVDMIEHKSRDKTKWDESDIQVHFRRQKYYMQLPEVFKKLGIKRNYELIDASVHPYDVVRKVIMVTAKILIKNKKLQVKPVQVKRICEELIHNGSLRQFDDAWQTQQVIL